MMIHKRSMVNEVSEHVCFPVHHEVLLIFRNFESQLHVVPEGLLGQPLTCLV